MSDFDAGDDGGNCVGEGTKRASKGTIQLLDHLGHGFVDGMVGIEGGEGDTCYCEGEKQRAPSAPERFVAGKVASSKGAASSAAAKRALLPPHSKQSATAANLASLSRIRALVTSDEGGLQSQAGQDGGEVDRAARRGSSPPDAITIFKGVRILLEQNAGDQPGTEEVALECLAVLKESFSWLSRTHIDGQNLEFFGRDGPKLVEHQGTGHGSQAARACISSTVKSVIDCVSRRSLRDRAEDVLVECTAEQARMPDAPRLLVEEVVHHGMEHDDTAVRLWSTLLPPRLLARGLQLEEREYNSILEGLVGRVRDVDNQVLCAAVESLGRMYRAERERFRAAEACIGPVYHQLLQHYGPRIRALPRDAAGYHNLLDARESDDADISATGIGSPGVRTLPARSNRRLAPTEMKMNPPSPSVERCEGGSGTPPVLSRISSPSNSDDAAMGWPRFEPLSDGVVVVSGGRSSSTSPCNAETQAAATASAATVASLCRSAEERYDNSKEDIKPCRSDTGHNEGESGNSPGRQPAGSGSPPRPVLAGPTAIEVSAVLGGDDGVGSCAVGLRATADRSRSTCGGGGNLDSRRGNDGRDDGGGGGPTSSPTSSPKSTRSSPMSSKAKTNSTIVAAPTESTWSSPPFRRDEVKGGARSGEVRPPRKIHHADPAEEKSSSSSSFPAELLCILNGVDSARMGYLGSAPGKDPGFLGPSRLPEAINRQNSETAGSRRQERVRAMEDAKRLILDMDGGAVLLVKPRLEELLVVTLRLTDNPDFKIALLALQTLHVLVLRVGKHLQSHLALLLRSLVEGLGDHKVAARHHAMVVLSALVRAVGLPASAPHLVRNGLRSTTWRAREGSLKLVIAGLLMSLTGHDASGRGGDPAGGTSGPQIRLDHHKEEELSTGSGKETEGEVGSGRGGWVRGKGNSWESTLDGKGAGGAEAVVLSESVVDEPQLVLDVGALLGDERPEVRFAAVETLAVAAHVWKSNDADVMLVLEDAGFLRSDEARRRLAARLQDHPSSLSRFGPDDTVNLGSGLAAWRSPERVAARGGAEVARGGQEATATPPVFARYPEDHELGSGTLPRYVSVGRNSEVLGSDGSTGGASEGKGAVNTATPPYDSGHHLTPATTRAGVSPGHNAGVDGAPDHALSCPSAHQGGRRARRQSPRSALATNQNMLKSSTLSDRNSAIGKKSTRDEALWATAATVNKGTLGVTAPASLGGSVGEIPGEDKDADEADYDREPTRGGQALRCWRSDGAGELQEVSPWERRGRKGAEHPDAGRTDRRSDKDAMDNRRRRRTEAAGHLGSSETGIPVRRASSPDLISRSDVYVPSWAGRGQQGGARYHQQQAGKVGELSSPSSHELEEKAETVRGFGVSADGSGDGDKNSAKGRRTHRRPKSLSASPELPLREHSKSPSTSTWVERGGEQEEGQWRQEDSVETITKRGGGDPRRTSPALDPSLLSTLKRGGSRNARASRRAVSAAASGGGNALSGSGGAGGGDPISPSKGGGRAGPRGGVPAEPTTPVPVGRYDSMGRRRHMETTVQQPLPLARTGVGSDAARHSLGGRNVKTFVTDIDADTDGERGQARSPVSPTHSPNQRRHGAMAEERQEPQEADGSSPNIRRRERHEKGKASGEIISPGSHRSNQRERGKWKPAIEANEGCSRLGRKGEGTRHAGQRGAGPGTGAGVGRSSPVGGGGATVILPLAVSTLKPDSFDYLTAEDIRPSPNPTQELHRAMSSLPRDDWPEIFHTLNSVRRLAAHHTALLSSQPHLHALVRDVLGQSENLRSQVAKNALLTLADLWRGLGETLDPELPMVCPILVKKLADKVEFLADAARECVDEVVATASDSRALSAFLACGSHRSPAVRAKSALAILLCVRRRSTTGAPVTIRATRRGDGGGEGGSGARRGGNTNIGAREMDRLLSSLRRFLQDGNQETRLHAKTLVALLLDSGEVDEVRLRREIPPPVLERLQRELLNSSMPSGPGFTAPSAAPTALGHPSPARRLAQGSGGGSTGGNAGGLLRPADSDSSPSEYPSVGSGGIGSGGVGLSGRGGRGGVAAGAMGRERWIGGGWPQERRGVEEEEFVEEPREFSPGVPRQNPRSRVWTDERSDGDPDANRDIPFLRHNQAGRTKIAAASHDARGPQASYADARRRGTSTDAREATKMVGRGSRSSISPPNNGSRDSGRATTKRSKVPFCKEVERLPGVFARLDSSDWRERMSGLEEATVLLEEHGGELHAADKSARLVDRMAELLSDGNLKVNLMALDSVVRLASCMGPKLEPVVNTLVPAVCKNLASSNQQRVALAEEALDALCEAVDPCLVVQPVASLAQYGNSRLKVPMLTLLRDLTPVVGEIKPQLLTKHVRPAALSLVRENHPNVRDAGLSLLRAVEIALDPTSSSSRGGGGARRKSGRGGTSILSGTSSASGGSRGSGRPQPPSQCVASSAATSSDATRSR